MLHSINVGVSMFQHFIRFIFSAYNVYIRKTLIQSANYIKCYFIFLVVFAFVLAMSFKIHHYPLTYLSQHISVAVITWIFFSPDTLKIDFLSNNKTRNSPLWKILNKFHEQIQISCEQGQSEKKTSCKKYLY